jgi:hypothetical protein
VAVYWSFSIRVAQSTKELNSQQLRARPKLSLPKIPLPNRVKSPDRLGFSYRANGTGARRIWLTLQDHFRDHSTWNSQFRSFVHWSQSWNILGNTTALGRNRKSPARPNSFRAQKNDLHSAFPQRFGQQTQDFLSVSNVSRWFRIVQSSPTRYLPDGNPSLIRLRKGCSSFNPNRNRRPLRR